MCSRGCGPLETAAESPDRDDAVVKMATSKAAAINSTITSTDSASSTTPVQNQRVPGRLLELGFAPYEPPALDTQRFDIYESKGKKIAVPRSFSINDTKQLLYVIHAHGPKAVRYVLHDEGIYAPRRH